jgi:ubiquinone/menaquinone biosynthesis C-methylase UbiE
MSDIKTWTGERLENFIYNENTNEHLHRYALALELVVGKQVLDISSGEGYGANLLAQVAAQVTGADIDAVAVALAKRKYKQDNLKFLTGAADKLPCATGSFDIVVSFETIEHYDQHQDMMQEIKRVLKPGGLLIISSPDKLYYNDKPQFKNHLHVKELYQDEFELLLKGYFNNISFLQQRSFWGSIIIPQSGPATDAKMYIGNYDEITHTDIKAKYIIALASDGAVPAFRTSLFNGETILKHQFDTFRELIAQNAKADVTSEIKNSRTYKIGDAIIKRLRLIKKIFKR